MQRWCGANSAPVCSSAVRRSEGSGKRAPTARRAGRGERRGGAGCCGACRGRGRRRTSCRCARAVRGGSWRAESRASLEAVSPYRGSLNALDHAVALSAQAKVMSTSRAGRTASIASQPTLTRHSSTMASHAMPLATCSKQVRLNQYDWDHSGARPQQRPVPQLTSNRSEARVESYLRAAILSEDGRRRERARVVKPFHFCRVLEALCRDIPGFPALRQNPRFIVKPLIVLALLRSAENEQLRFQIPSGTPGFFSWRPSVSGWTDLCRACRFA